MKRRTILGALGSATLFSGAVKPRTSIAADAVFDPKNPDHVLMAFRKLAYAADDSVTYMWLRATRFGLVDTKFTPFWEMHVGSMSTTRDLEGGAFEVTGISAIFYTDPDTGTFLETFKNPFTGKSVDVRYSAPRVSKRVYTRDGEERHAPDRPGMTVTTAGALGPAWIEGDHLWVRADTHLSVDPMTGETGRVQRVNDWSTYQGSLAQISNPDVRNPPSEWIFNDINTWPEWLGMGDQPGNYVSRGIGHKAFAFDEMPKTWTSLMRQRHPDIANDPVGALKG